jgi:hypothetical protein
MHCKTCNTTKSAADFYAGSKSTCKACVCERVRANRLAKIDHYRAFDKARASQPHRVAARKEYQRTAAFAESHKAAAKRWRDRHPERRSAHVALDNAVRDGRVTPWPACAIPECDCKPEAHHADYSRPLDVVWLCTRHHKETHKMARDLAANDPLSRRGLHLAL